MMRECWFTYAVTSSPSYMLAQKLKLLKEDLKSWNREVFGHLEGQREAVVSLLSLLDDVESERGLSPEDLPRF